jgi:capsular polysaccharide export protein
MIKGGLRKFKGKHVVLLQGPVGPFFKRLAADLKWAGATVSKINFNGGDWLFSPPDSILFRGSPSEWPAFFERFIHERKIELVILFGDCRPIHRAAHAIALKHGLEIGVFEEGYIRPDYITFERHGVNAHSNLPRTPHPYLNGPYRPPRSVQQVGRAFWFTALWAILYYAAAHALKPLFLRYEHHRPLNIWEGLYWLRSFWRRYLYQFEEAGVQTLLTNALSKSYFLVALQLPNDFQVVVHSGFDTVQDFITHVVDSFAAHADAGQWLVFKHHPLDRGYNNYKKHIMRAARRHGVAGRVLYIHDQHLPTVLEHALGVVVINSTVGLTAIEHGLPVKTCGEAFYDMPGLTFQDTLDAFWKEGQAHPPSADLHRRFYAHLVAHTQLNGNFYRRLPLCPFVTGLVWDMEPNTAPSTTPLLASNQKSP